MRYAYALTGALLLGGAAATMTLQPAAFAQTAQNEPGAIQATAPKAGAPMSFADMVARLSPAVVNIATSQRIVQRQQANPFAGTPFGDLFGGMGGGDSGPATPREAESLGSGFIISPDGYIVTNNHVIAAGEKGATVESIKVTLQDRKEYTAKLIGHDQTSDLALLKITAPGPLPYVRWGDSNAARVGDWVVAIGQPFGLGGTVTAGIISAVHRSIGQAGPYDRLIQTDAAINQGNSGGPMFDLNGNVIGINQQILGSSAGGNIGIGFAIPAEEARPIIDKLRTGAAIKRGYLGVSIQPLNDDFAAATGLPANQGELIGRVEPGGPGARAGLRPYDVVTRVNGAPVTPDATLAYLIAGLQPGQVARLDVIRDNKPVTINATVGTRPSEDALKTLAGGGDGDEDGIPDDQDNGAQTAQASPLGVTVQPLTPAIARSLGVDSSVQGVVIASVDPTSDAGVKGLKRGDVISAINSQPVRTAADLARGVAAAKAAGRTQVLLLLTRGRNPGAYLPIKIKN